MNIMALDDEKAKGYVALNGFFGICREWGGLPRRNYPYKYQALPHVNLVTWSHNC